MNMKRQIKSWLCLALFQTSIAFSPVLPHHRTNVARPSSLGMTASLNLKDIDIDDVLAQTEQALMVAQDILPSSASSSIGKEWTDITKMQQEIEQMTDQQRKQEASKILQHLASSLSHKVSETIEFAHHHLEEEEDLSKVPEKIMLAMQSKVNQDIEGLVNKAHGDFEDLVVKANTDIDELRVAPTKIKKKLKKTVTKDNLKKAPGRAFSALRRFIGSDEVKQASSTAAKVIKDGLESPGMKALKSQATNALLASSTKKPQLIDVSDRDIDISDVLAEAEAALIAAEVAEPVADKTKTPPKPQLIDVSNRDIDISDVLAEAEAALMAAEVAEPVADKTKTPPKATKAESNVFQSIMKPKTPQLIDVSDRDIDITGVLAEAEVALTAAETAESINRAQDAPSETILALSEVVSFINQRLSPIRKSNRAILAHTLCESMLLQKQLLRESRERIILFVKMVNDRTSPVRKFNRSALAYSLTEFVMLQKKLLQTGCDEIISFSKEQNARMSPIRADNRSILRHTLIEALLLQKEMLETGRDNAAFFLKTQNDRMQPIRAANRVILARNLIEFWKLQKELAGTAYIKMIRGRQKLSQFVQGLHQKITEDFSDPPPEAVLLGHV